jgi:hypothetical protein
MTLYIVDNVVRNAETVAANEAAQPTYLDAYRQSYDVTVDNEVTVMETRWAFYRGDGQKVLLQGNSIFYLIPGVAIRVKASSWGNEPLGEELRAIALVAEHAHGVPLTGFRVPIPSDKLFFANSNSYTFVPGGHKKERKLATVKLGERIQIDGPLVTARQVVVNGIPLTYLIRREGVDMRGSYLSYELIPPPLRVGFDLHQAIRVLVKESVHYVGTSSRYTKELVEERKLLQEQLRARQQTAVE